MKTYLISGLSGTGKSTVCEELKKRGYQTVDADKELAYFADPETLLPVDVKTSHWLWHKEKFHNAIRQDEGKPVFVCGGATNEEEFKLHFDKIFTLYVNDEVM